MSFSWAPRYFSKNLLSHSFTLGYSMALIPSLATSTWPLLPNLVPANLRCSQATNSSSHTLASHTHTQCGCTQLLFPFFTRDSTPLLHQDIQNTLCQPDVFAVTSPPDQRGRKQRVRMALISDSVFSTLLLPLTAPSNC